MTFKQSLIDISSVLNNVGDTTKLITSFNALDLAQKKALLSSNLLTESQKLQCVAMTTLVSENATYTAEQLAKITGVSAENIATLGLKKSTDSLTISQIAEKASTNAQAKSILEKIVAQNAQIAANNGVSATNTILATTEGGATIATGAFTTAIKANIVALRAWLTTTPAGWLALLASGVFIAAKAYDALTTSIDEQRCKMEDAASEYSDAKSNLESITSELKNQQDAIDDLKSKGNLTYAEKGELDNLKEITEELRIQRDIEERNAATKSKDAAVESAKLFNKQFGSNDISYDSIADYYSNNDSSDLLVMAGTKDNNIAEIIAGYRKINEQIQLAYGEKNQEAITRWNSFLDNTKDTLFSLVGDLQEQKSNMSDYYNLIKDTPYVQLSSEQKTVVDSYKATAAAIALIYKELDPNKWNSMQIENVLADDGIEKTKDELIQMAQSGKLTPDVIKSYQNLNAALEDSDLALEDGKSAADAFCKEIVALAKEQGSLNKTTITPFSKEEMISQINGLSEGFEELDKIMKSVKDTKSPFDYALLDDKNFKEKFSGLGKAYTDFVEKVASSPNDIKGCQSTFDDLATAYVNNSGILNGLSDDTATLTTDMLKNMGVANAEEVVMAALGQKKAAAAAETKNLADMSDEEIDAFLTEQGATADTIDAFKAYVAEKQLANFAIDPNGDIEALNAIMVKLGAAGNAWKNYYRYKKDLDAINNGEVYTVAGTKMYKYTDVDGRTHHMSENGKKQLEDLTSSQYNSVMNELKTGSDLKLAHYSGGPKTNKESSSGSSKKENKEEKETFDWTERKLEIIANQHDKINDYISNETKSIDGQQAALSEIISFDQQKMDVLKQQIEVYKQYWLKALSEIDEEQLKIYGNGMSKSDLISKITNGALDIQDFVLLEGSTDAQETAYKKLVENIKNAQSAYQDVEDTEKKLDDTEQDIADHQKERYEKRIEQIEAENDALKSRQDIIQADLDLLEASGGIELEGMYQELIDLSKQQMSLYEEEAAAARDRMSEVEAGSTEYYQLESKINDCTQSIKECQKEQAEWQETIKRLPIERIQKYINMLQNIKQDLQNFIDEQNSLGISTTVDQYKQLMDICQKEIDKLLEQQKKLSDLLGTYQYGSEKFNDVQDEIQDIDDTISGLIQNMYEWNNSIMQIPIDQLSKVNEQLNLYSNSLGDVLDNYDSVLSAVTGTIDQQIQSLEDLKTATEKSYEEQTKPIEEKISLLQRENEARSKQISLEEAQYNLEKARNQKNVQVVKNGSLTYIADEESIRQAQSDLSEAKYNKIVFDLQNEVDRLNDEKNKLLENYDQQIEKLQTVEDKWSKIKDQIQLAADTIKATDLFGSGWQDKVLSGKDDDLYNMFKNLYESTSTEKDKVDEQIASNERIVTMMQRFVELYQDGSITYEKAMAGITQMATQMKDGYSALEQLNGLMNIDGIGKISDISASTNAKVDQSVQLLGEYMGIAKANSDTISQYTSTWNEMKDNIAAQLAQLEKMAKELEEYVKNHTYSSGSSSSSRDHDSGSSSSSGGGSGNNYVAAGPGYSDEGMQEAINRGDRIEFDGSGGGKTEQEIKDTYKEMTKNKRHSGVEKGPVGGNGDSNDKYAKLAKELGLKSIKPYEYPAFLKQGEIVFTQEQMKQMGQNLQALSTPKYMTVPDNVIKRTDQSTNIDFKMGDVVLNNVQDVDGFAKAVSQTFKSKMRQELTVQRW